MTRPSSRFGRPAPPPALDAACAPVMQSLESRLLMAIHTPANGDQLQTAINNAALGDTIVLQAGVTYVTSSAGPHDYGFILRNKTSGSGWITIQSSNLAQLPGL